MQSFPEIVLQRAQLKSDDVACRFFKGPALAHELMTFGALWERASGWARKFQAQGLAQQRAVLVCKSQQNFVVAFYACLLAGVVAVPASPPRRQNSQNRLQIIVHDAGAHAIIFDSDEFLQAELAVGDEALLRIDMREPVETFADPVCAAQWEPARVEVSTPAFLQYTSGSTGDPKGVVVTHGNLVDNCAAIQDGMEITGESRLFTALPLFHDMGLVGGVLQFMYSGCSASFLSPAEFVQYPERWLHVISEFRITVSGGPNFMYDLAARTVRDEAIAGVDLSSWGVAFCGAEPIRAGVIDRFTQRFAAHGFRAEAFYPCYGMAESTLLITGVQVGAAPTLRRHGGAEVVGCGSPRGDARIEIVDPETSSRMAEGQEGEIWVRGGSVAHGYWMRPELSQRVFHARIDGAGPGHLRTGDLGFMLDGQLYVTGRLKDLIIVNGRKYAPQDIEDRCEQSHEALRQAGGAAFGISDVEGERLVVVFELKREWLRRRPDLPAVVGSMRASVNAEYGLPVADIVLLKPGALPRTSSGKVRRMQCRMDYLSGELERVAAH
ncbi:fatty acyl-AMP ligase [Xanthomonas sp. NCPPB 2654]|uniref:fatty acyl-AMP ligase n=1 Tax=unclassified Xanthomonas TaxID=2643310 RepID=UPI0021DF67F1|nr:MULTISPECIES: fatty acyl-AMP ligase [unclassified Xanthomonas]MDL5364778.1 fatty acyl-AMP ligase [Xanthomonas sp. NCPPB 2654]UYC18806.1 fatty acyl-AMP ligase [Xanthomonas sp. CFBP 8443]